MDPVSVAAAVVGISQFGGQLAHSLYKLGVNVSSARRQSNKISERMTDYTTILDILEATLDADNHVFSRKAEDAILKHCDRSWDLFEEIEKLLPPRRRTSGKDELTWMDKLKWNFRRSRVELLLGELEFVKSDVVLLLVTQLLGQKIRSYKKSKSKSNKKQQKATVDDYTLKAENAILRHMNAAENLSNLQQDAEHEDKEELITGSRIPAANESRALTLVSRQNEIIARFQEALMEVEDPSRRQALILQKSPMLLQDLLAQWTRTDLDDLQETSRAVETPDSDCIEVPDSLSRACPDDNGAKRASLQSLKKEIAALEAEREALRREALLEEAARHVRETGFFSTGLTSVAKEGSFENIPTSAESLGGNQGHDGEDAAPSVTTYSDFRKQWPVDVSSVEFLGLGESSKSQIKSTISETDAAPNGNKDNPTYIPIPGPAEKLGALDRKFLFTLKPSAEDFLRDPPTEPELRRQRSIYLSEEIMRLIVLEADAIDTQGYPEARIVRKMLVEDANWMMQQLDHVRKGLNVGSTPMTNYEFTTPS